MEVVQTLLPGYHQASFTEPRSSSWPHGSVGPPGKRNGQYRHGERTKAAIAEQRRFGALLKMLRAGLA